MKKFMSTHKCHIIITIYLYELCNNDQYGMVCVIFEIMNNISSYPMNKLSNRFRD